MGILGVRTETFENVRRRRRGGKQAVIFTLCHKGVCPGSGSYTSSAPPSPKVTDTAQASISLCSAFSTSAVSTVRLNWIQATESGLELLFQVMDIDAASQKGVIPHETLL